MSGDGMGWYIPGIRGVSRTIGTSRAGPAIDGPEAVCPESRVAVVGNGTHRYFLLLLHSNTHGPTVNAWRERVSPPSNRRQCEDSSLIEAIYRPPNVRYPIHRNPSNHEKPSHGCVHPVLASASPNLGPLYISLWFRNIPQTD